ncbi:hypothetical protein D3C80_2217160 [compost metagenome]
MMMPWVSKMIGSQKLEATDTAARSTALTWPAITVSTKLMATWATWATRMGLARRTSCFASDQ